MKLKLTVGGLPEGDLDVLVTVKQVVTVCAPIGRFTEIDYATNVIAYEVDGNIVTSLDGTENPAEWQTIKQDNGGGTGSHNALLYSEMVKDYPPGDAAALAQFFDPEGKATDYYAHK